MFTGIKFYTFMEIKDLIKFYKLNKSLTSQQNGGIPLDISHNNTPILYTSLFSFKEYDCAGLDQYMAIF
jgi:hypothetical protein